MKSQWNRRVEKCEEKTKERPAKPSRGKVVLKESVLDISSSGANVAEKKEKLDSLDESLLQKLQKTGLIKWDESFDLEDMTQVNKELDKWLEQSGE